MKRFFESAAVVAFATISGATVAFGIYQCIIAFCWS